MKKVSFLAAVVVLAAPAWGGVEIFCEQVGDSNEVVVSCDAGTEPVPIRAFALDLGVSEGNIVDVNCVSADYSIHPGSIYIDENGNVIDYGSCVCDAAYPGTLGGLGTSGITIEMGCLYVGEANAPDPCGVLLTFVVDGTGTIDVTIGENTMRHGVVSEDYEATVEVNAPGCTIDVNPYAGTCWDPCECVAQMLGDASCDGHVSLADLAKLKRSFFKSKGEAGYDCCADFDHSSRVDYADLAILKVNFYGGPYAPSTGEQSCPP